MAPPLRKHSDIVRQRPAPERVERRLSPSRCLSTNVNENGGEEKAAAPRFRCEWKKRTRGKRKGAAWLARDTSS